MGWGGRVMGVEEVEAQGEDRVLLGREHMWKEDQGPPSVLDCNWLCPVLHQQPSQKWFPGLYYLCKWMTYADDQTLFFVPAMWMIKVDLFLYLQILGYLLVPLRLLSTIYK